MATDVRHRRGHDTVSLAEPRIVLALNGAALTVVLFHIITDYHIGLFGASSSVMGPAQAANALQFAVTFGGWMVAVGVAMRGSATGTAAALVFVVIQAVLLNGVFAFAVAPPPSDAFPYQDIAHGAGVVFGVPAALALRTRLAVLDDTVDRRWIGVVLLWLFLFSPLLGFWASPISG